MNRARIDNFRWWIRIEPTSETKLFTKLSSTSATFCDKVNVKNESVRRTLDDRTVLKALAIKQRMTTSRRTCFQRHFHNVPLGLFMNRIDNNGTIKHCTIFPPQSRHRCAQHSLECFSHSPLHVAVEKLACFRTRATFQADISSHVERVCEAPCQSRTKLCRVKTWILCAPPEYKSKEKKNLFFFIKAAEIVVQC